jgi:hypothetical protein
MQADKSAPLTWDDRQRAGVMFLVGDGQHAHLYRTSSVFKGNVDMLVRMLPAWVDGIAAESAAAEARIREAIEVMSRAPMAPMIFPCTSAPDGADDHSPEGSRSAIVRPD